jgi:hypothetical protein
LKYLRLQWKTPTAKLLQRIVPTARQAAAQAVELVGRDSVPVILFALFVRTPSPIVDTESHKENRCTDGPTQQKDEDKFLAASHRSNLQSI